MKTIDDLFKDRERELERAKMDYDLEWNRIHERYDRLMNEAGTLGGLIWRDELAAFLGISEPRVSLLISTGRFRSDASGRKFSLADVEEYKRTRKPGRPKRSGTWYNR